MNYLPDRRLRLQPLPGKCSGLVSDDGRPQPHEGVAPAAENRERTLMPMLNKNLRMWEVAQLYAESQTIVAPGVEAFVDGPPATRRRAPAGGAATTEPAPKLA